MSRSPRKRSPPSSLTRNERLGELPDLHRDRREAILSRLADFAAVPSTEYFYELAYCLMTPQSSAVNADAVIAHLRAANFQEHPFNAEDVLRTKEHYIRFHRTKARHLLAAHGQISDIYAALRENMSAPAARDWLIKNVKGLGLKEATHFLRNIGRNQGLAILDRHILRNLVKYGAIRRIPTSLTRKRYLQIEKKFTEFADRVGIPLDELDLLFWSMETGEIRK